MNESSKQNREQRRERHRKLQEKRKLLKRNLKNTDTIQKAQDVLRRKEELIKLEQQSQTEGKTFEPVKK